MNIDFHHGVIYVLARLTGFEPNHANIIAYSSQYVDDACNKGVITFSNEPHARYYRINSSQNLNNPLEDVKTYTQDDVFNQHIWVPFHFLPGNAGRKLAEGDEGLTFLDKIICKPNSPVAQDLVAECLKRKDDKYSLYRLGITMHVYADTWAHQGFAGINDPMNDVTDINTNNLDDLLTNATNKALPPLGHGRALHFPDYPFLEKWSYTNGSGQQVTRKNHSEFLDAAINIFRALQLFLKPNEQPRDLLPQDLSQISLMLSATTSPNENERHQAWLNDIRNGAFSFGPEEPPFYPPNGKGIGSWKYAALKTADIWDTCFEFTFDKSFLTCDWKMFHDALQAHRFYVLHDLLPQYGILCCLPD